MMDTEKGAWPDQPSWHQRRLAEHYKRRSPEHGNGAALDYSACG
jgi:hypothetical protein